MWECLYNSVAMVLVFTMDFVLIGILIGPGAAAVYGVVSRVMGISRQVLQSLAEAAWPRLTQELDTTRKAQMMRKVDRLNAWMVGCWYGAMAITLLPFLSWLVKTDWVAPPMLAGLIVARHFIISLISPHAYGLLSAARFRDLAHVNWSEVIVGLSLGALLTWIYGVNGTALAFLCSTMFAPGWQMTYRYFRFAHDTHWLSEWFAVIGRGLIGATVSSIIAFTIWSVVRTHFGTAGWLAIGVGGIAFAIPAAGILLFWRVAKESHELPLDLLARAAPKSAQPMSRQSRILIVGAGFAGAVLARELAEAGLPVLLIDSRDHLAGNCHTQRDPDTKILVHRYGAHIFHTDRLDVWKYVQRFAEFRPFFHRVKASIDRGVFGLPITLATINQFYGKRLAPDEARKFVTGLGDKSIDEPRNFEEQALKLLGRELYQAFFYGYSKKQWGCEPHELSASILKRLPVRFNYDEGYYTSSHQGMPFEGYTALFRRLVQHENIKILLSTSWTPEMQTGFEHIVFTGPLDQYFGYRFGHLGYRTVHWENQTLPGDFQGTAVMNYPGMEKPFTRIVEHKHFAPWEKHERTFVSTEFSKETEPIDVPFYPKRLATDKAILASYIELAQQEQKVSFLGRLGTYRYLDMHQVIGESLDFAPKLIQSLRTGQPRPIFPAAM